ncbi:MAG: hypothetical protein U1E13_01505 [Methylophilaceae bacterium]|nr:hypothetical protein [Methylophilaceae bacterium]
MMKLNKMSLREQVVVLIVALVIIGGAYGTFRFYPANKAIVDIKKNTQMMDSAMKTTVIPEEPFESADDLKLDLAYLEEELTDAKAMLTMVEQRLSTSDTTEVRLAMSEVARTSLIRINANEEFRVILPPPLATVAKTTTTKGATAEPPKRLGDAAQRRLRRQAREARQANRYGAGVSRAVATATPEQVTDLVRKMAVNGAMERPMQRLTMEGTYAAIMRFIQGLEDMDKMVTIVHLQMMPTPQSPPPGYNQRLTATMVLAL